MLTVHLFLFLITGVVVFLLHTIFKLMKYLSWEYFDGIILIFWTVVFSVSLLVFALGYQFFYYFQFIGLFIITFITVYRLGTHTGMSIFVPFLVGILVFYSYRHVSSVSRFMEANAFAFVLTVVGWIPTKWVFTNLYVKCCKSRKKLEHEAMVNEILKQIKGS